MKNKLAAALLLLTFTVLSAWGGSNRGGGSTGTINVDKPALYFGFQSTGAVSSPQTLTLTNNTTYAFAITGVSAETGFTVASSNCGVLQVGQSCTVQVAFVPLHTANYASRLNLATPYSTAALTVPLYGSGS